MIACLRLIIFVSFPFFFCLNIWVVNGWFATFSYRTTVRQEHDDLKCSNLTSKKKKKKKNLIRRSKKEIEIKKYEWNPLKKDIKHDTRVKKWGVGGGGGGDTRPQAEIRWRHDAYTIA